MAEIDVIRRVIFDEHDEPLEIGPWPDDPSLVHLRTCDEDGINYWGNVNLALKADQADALGRALISCAIECKAKESK